MKAIILAAGASKRMMFLTANLPKCLLKIGDKSIIEHQIASLHHYGLDEIVVVTGFCEDKIKETCGDSVRYISNPIFGKTNSIYSLWLAKKKRRKALCSSIPMCSSILWFWGSCWNPLTLMHWP